MNTDLEDRLTRSMQHTVAGIAPPGDVLGRARSRHSRRTVTIRTAYALGAAGMAGVLAVTLPQTGGQQPGGGPAPAVAEAPAALQLVNAAQASDNLSYRIKLRTSGLDYEGAFDPRTDTGYLRAPQDDSVMTELLIDGTRYVGGERPPGALPPDKGPGEKYGRYGQYPGKHHRLSLYLGSDPALDAVSPDPAALFQALKAAGATVVKTPDGVLRFTRVTRSATESITTTADVTLDKDGRIARVALGGSGISTAKGKPVTVKFTAVLELYDYGVTVRVKRPADVVPTR